MHRSRPLSCHSRVARALCMFVHVRGAVSCELCVCGVFFCVRWIDVCGALGMSASVESWSWQRLCVCACVSEMVFVRGWCLRWMFVVGVCKVFGV